MARVAIKQISMCEGCPHFRVDMCAYGDAALSCVHPNGPGGKLTTDLITKMQIHHDCPLLDSEELSSTLRELIEGCIKNE